MDAENFLSGQFVPGQKFIRPFFLVRRQENFHFVRRQFYFRADQRQHVEIIFNRVPRVILRQGLVHKPAVEPAKVFVFVADAHRRADDARGDAIMDPALRMRVDGNVVAIAPQRPEESQRLQLAAT